MTDYLAIGSVVLSFFVYSYFLWGLGRTCGRLEELKNCGKMLEQFQKVLEKKH